jgi:hypothetical protein
MHLPVSPFIRVVTSSRLVIKRDVNCGNLCWMMGATDQDSAAAIWFKDGLRPEARRHQPPSVVLAVRKQVLARSRQREAGAAARARAESKRRDVSHPSPCRKRPALPLSAVATASFFSRSDDDQIGKLKGIIVRLLEPPRTERRISAKSSRRRKRGEPSNYILDFSSIDLSLDPLRYLYRQNTLRE